MRRILLPLALSARLALSDPVALYEFNDQFSVGSSSLPSGTFLSSTEGTAAYDAAGICAGQVCGDSNNAADKGSLVCDGDDALGVNGGGDSNEIYVFWRPRKNSLLAYVRSRSRNRDF